MTDKEFIKKPNSKNGERASNQLKDSPFDPVKLIGDLIRYQIVAIKSQAIKSGGK